MESVSPTRSGTLTTVTETKRRRIDRIQDEDFLVDLAAIPIDELRARRSMCDDLDVELSYYRRMLHGRMDLLAFEMRRRAGEEQQTLLEALPRILSEGGYSAVPGLPERAVPIEVPDISSPKHRIVELALSGDVLARLPSMEDDELRDTQAFLSEVEIEVSTQRRIVYSKLDRLQTELTRRYREGLADPGELLNKA